MGIDSVAAYLYLRNRGYSVFPIHYNHKLREQNNVMQRKFIELIELLTKPNSYNDNSNFCATNEFDSGFSEATEAECRNNRLNYFREVCSQKNIQYVVTAHHLDDCVESYLLNCFRGHSDYQPIKVVSDFVSYKMIHPFVLTEKVDFEQYLLSLDNGKYQQYVVRDETNDIIKGSRRNWIRNVIVPELNKQQIGLKRFCRGQIQKQLENYS